MMEEKWNLIFGVGRVGGMFYREILRKNEKVFGIEKRKFENFFVKVGESSEKLEVEIFEKIPKERKISFVFFCVKNPIDEIFEDFCYNLKEAKIFPEAIFFPQNGLQIREKAILKIKKVFGALSRKIDLLRIILLNSIDKKEKENKIEISYSHPVKIVLAKFWGEKNRLTFYANYLKKFDFKVYEFKRNDVENLEYSKLFLNLIGLYCAAKNLSIEEGFSKKDIFEKEILSLKEYINCVQKNNGKFVNLPGYPVSIFAFLIKNLPLSFISLFRKKIGKIVEKKREKKPKDISEIDFYTGAVVKLGEKVNLQTPVNKEIFEILKSKWIGKN
jgi:2-dehydropantoate 2-reductase